jgi:FkbM family methyltransferase
MFKIPFKYVLQKLLGFEKFLYTFSLFTIHRMRVGIFNKEFKYFLNLMPEDGNILDLGSNIGITAVPIARRVCRGRVLCFEPIPMHIKTLRKITTHFHLSNVEIFETALGEANGELLMVMPVFCKVKFQGFSHVVEKDPDKKKGDLFTVPVQRLDSLQALQKINKINAIKIDVENFEYPVLQGAEELIMRFKPIIYCELWNDEKRFLTINYLKNKFGYQVKVFKKNKLEEFTGQAASNFFFVQPNQKASPKFI